MQSPRILAAVGRYGWRNDVSLTCDEAYRHEAATGTCLTRRWFQVPRPRAWELDPGYVLSLHLPADRPIDCAPHALGRCRRRPDFRSVFSSGVALQIQRLNSPSDRLRYGRVGGVRPRHFPERADIETTGVGCNIEHSCGVRCICGRSSPARTITPAGAGCLHTGAYFGLQLDWVLYRRQPWCELAARYLQ